MKRSLNSFHDGKSGSAITVAIQYGAKATKITKFQKDGTVDIELLCAAPGNEADKELMKFLAKTLNVAEKNLEMLAGSSENKLISIIDISPEEVDELLNSAL